MYTPPEMMRALQQVRSEDLSRRPTAVVRPRRSLVPRIAFRWNAPSFRAKTRSTLSATVRSP
jgi:hypothetical protein